METITLVLWLLLVRGPLDAPHGAVAPIAFGAKADCVEAARTLLILHPTSDPICEKRLAVLSVAR